MLKNDFRKLKIGATFESSNQENDTLKIILKRNMNTINLLSKLTKSEKLETVNGLNQALECIGVDQMTKKISQNQAIEIGKVIVEKFAGIMDLTNLVESIKETVSVEELESFKNEISGKLNSVVITTTQAPIYQKRMATLKNSFEEVSGDNVL